MSLKQKPEEITDKSISPTFPRSYFRPNRQTGHDGRTDFMIANELVETLKQLSYQEDTTLFEIFLAALYILMNRYSGQEDLVVVTPMLGGELSETKRLLGNSLSTLALRIDLSDGLNFVDFLTQVRKMVQEVIHTKDVPFEKRVDELQTGLSLGHAPISQVLFNYERFSQSLPQAAGAETSEEVKGWSEEPLDLTIEIVETDDALSCMFRFNDDLIDARAVRHLHNQYLFILQQIARNPNSSLDSYSLVTDSSQDLLPDPREPIPEPSFHPIPELIALWANRTPAATAVEMGEECWTYRELTESASELARLLLAHGLSKEDVVAVQGKRSFGLISSMIGVLMAGGVLLTIDPNLPLERQAIMLREAGAAFMVSTDNQAVQVDAGILCIQVTSQTGKPRSGERQQQQIELPELKGKDPTYIFFTSGTTGVPKGILGDHKGLAHFLDWQRNRFAIGPGDRASQLIGLSFDVVLRDIFLALTSGATLILPPEEVAFEAGEIIRWFKQKHVTLIHTVPSLAQLWIAAAKRLAVEKNYIKELRWVFFAGEPLNKTNVD